MLPLKLKFRPGLVLTNIAGLTPHCIKYGRLEFALDQE